jgi:site-specific recombinase XerD
MKRDPKTGAPDFYTFARDYLHTYLPTVQGRSPKTIEAYRISLECFLDYLADHQHIDRAHVTFDHFDRDHLKGWLAWMSDQRHYAARTIALRLSTVKAFLTYCSGEDITLVALSQAAKALRTPASARKPIEYLTEPETRAVLAAFTGRTAKSRRNRMLLILLYDTAARVGEITRLTLQDLCLHTPGHVRLTGKGDKTRVVPLTGKTIEHLHVYLAEFPRTRPRCRRGDRCSTARTTANRHRSRPTPSRQCSPVPPRPRAGPVPRSPRTCTATCCARPRPWTSTNKASPCRSSCDFSATRTYRPRQRSTPSPRWT